MLPRDLQAAHFNAYPPQARQLSVQHLPLFHQLPLSFLSGLLRELIEYDYRFPVERARIEEELSILGDLSTAQLAEWFDELSWKLPPKCKPWQSEDHNLTIFDAAATAMTFAWNRSGGTMP